MLKDWNHDLIHQLSETSDSVWRMEKYKAAAQGCEHCSTLWSALHQDYDRHIAMLSAEIERHVGEKRFD